MALSVTAAPELLDFVATGDNDEQEVAIGLLAELASSAYGQDGVMLGQIVRDTGGVVSTAAIDWHTIPGVCARRSTNVHAHAYRSSYRGCSPPARSRPSMARCSCWSIYALTQSTLRLGSQSAACSSTGLGRLCSPSRGRPA